MNILLVHPGTGDSLCARTNQHTAGVDFEEGGEKWRAGDLTKSFRFFTRAVETYDAGLYRFPQSFDLAYNKYSPPCTIYPTFR